jgi:hypothetical protein
LIGAGDRIVRESDERQGELFRGDASALSCGMTTIDLTDDELAAVIAALKQRIDREWKFRMSPRLEPFVSALAKLNPASASKPPPAPKPPLPEAPTRSRGGRRARR